MSLSCATCCEKNNISDHEEVITPFYQTNKKYNLAIAISLRKIPQNHESWIHIRLSGPTQTTRVGASQIKYFVSPQLLGRVGFSNKKGIGKAGIDPKKLDRPNIELYFKDSIKRDPMDNMGIIYTSIGSMFEEFVRDYFSMIKNNIDVHDGFTLMGDNNTACTPDGFYVNEKNQFCLLECKTYIGRRVTGEIPKDHVYQVHSQIKAFNADVGSYIGVKIIPCRVSDFTSKHNNAWKSFLHPNGVTAHITKGLGYFVIDNFNANIAKTFHDEGCRCDGCTNVPVDLCNIAFEDVVKVLSETRQVKTWTWKYRYYRTWTENIKSDIAKENGDYIFSFVVKDYICRDIVATKIDDISLLTGMKTTVAADMLEIAKLIIKNGDNRCDIASVHSILSDIFHDFKFQDEKGNRLDIKTEIVRRLTGSVTHPKYLSIRSAFKKNNKLNPQMPPIKNKKPRSRKTSLTMLTPSISIQKRQSSDSRGSSPVPRASRFHPCEV